MSNASAVVPIGYKQTEVGVIPEDWDVLELGRCGEVIMGQSPLSSTYNKTGLGAPLINGPTEFTERYPKKIQWTTKPSRNCRAGDLLICVRGSSTGRTNYANENYAIGRGVGAIRARNENDTQYLSYQVISSVSKILTASSGSTFPSVDGATLKRILVLLPSPIEQRAIKKALNDVDELIVSLKNQIEKMRDIKQGTMQELLTGKTRLPGFSDEWKTAKLKDFLKTPVTDGPHLTPIFHRTGIPFLSVNNLVNNRINFSELRYISNEDHIEFSKKCKPERNDILLGKAASVGKVAIIDFDLELNIWSPLALIRVNKKHNSKFVFYSFQSRNILYQIELLTNSSSQGNIGMGDIELLIFNLPEKDEQIAIAQVLSDMDAEIAALEERLEKAKAIKQGMMQQLLTGKIRLVEPQTSQEVSA